MNYIIITPAKNEEDFLPITAESMIRQTELPLLWLIVDDGSTDCTPKIIADLIQIHPWIVSIRLPPHPRDLFFHYSFVCREGFDYLIRYCEEHQVSYDYIGLVDADTELTPSYFQALIERFRADPHLGIASGIINDRVNGKIIERHEGYLPRGTGRLWSRECFCETDGYLVEAAAHSISNVKALLRGYTIQKFDDIVAVQQRETRSAEGLSHTFFKDGSLAHYLNKHPLLVLLNAVHHCQKRPYYPGISYFFGYLYAVVSRAEKISDEEIRNYYWNTRLNEIMTHYRIIRSSSR